ncbi:MAG: glycosyltransferase [Candidatus Omnitrophica bacterium]|nr:glycosyltransferase [Candidatus Omnitrophota bacterium]
MRTLAPIVLFVYKRPEHTLKVLRALQKNRLADRSELFIYSDGAPGDASDELIKAIGDVRLVIRQEQWCGKLHIIESPVNKGLADSIVDGVTEVVNKYGRIIVLEDDLVTSPGFLEYMNDALVLYKNEPPVMHISAYMPRTTGYNRLPRTFFLKYMSCWGWGTWKRAWDMAIWDEKYLYKRINLQKLWGQFNMGDPVQDYQKQLECNMSSEIRTWAIKWYASIFLEDGLSLFPKKSLIANIGLDASGEHCTVREDILETDLAEHIEVSRENIKELKKGRRYLKSYLKYGADSSWLRIVQHKAGLVKHKIAVALNLTEKDI